MLQFIRNKKCFRLLCAFIALYLLNCSVDSNDLQPLHYSEDLTFNDQESIIEVVIEKVLGFENAIPENEDADEENTSHLKKNISIAFYILPPATTKLNHSYIIKDKESTDFQRITTCKPFFEIHSPPPEI